MPELSTVDSGIEESRDDHEAKTTNSKRGFPQFGNKGNTMEKLFWNIAMFLLLLPTTIDAGKCGNVKDFCYLDKCVTTLLEDGMTICHRLNHPHTLREGRINDSPFSVEEENRRLKSYKNYKFGIMSLTEKDQTWRVVETCCNLKVNETCKLRPIMTGEYMYLLGTDGKGNFCWDHIEEKSPNELKWCSKTEKRPCLYFENGAILERRKFEDASFDSVKMKGEYCFFEIPEFLVTGNESDDGLIQNVRGIQLLGDKVLTESKNTTCNMKKGVISYSKHLSFNETKPANALCFFARVGNSPWLSTPHCRKRAYPPKNPDEGLGLVWKAIFGVLAGIVFLLFLALAVRFQIKICVPSYDETKGDIPKYITQIEESQKFLDDRGKELHTKELPDEIIIQGSKNDTDFEAESNRDNYEDYVVDAAMVNDNTEESKFKQPFPNSDEYVPDINATDVLPYVSKQDFCCEVNRDSEFAPKGQFQPYVDQIAMETANKKTMASPNVSGYTDKDDLIQCFGSKNQNINFVLENNQNSDNRDSSSTCDTFCELNEDDSIEELSIPICTCSENNIIPEYVKRVTIPGNESSLSHSCAHSNSCAKCKIYSFQSGDYVDKVFA